MGTYRNYTPVAWWDEKLAPVPGWGMRAKFLAGPKMIGVGDDTAPTDKFYVGLFAGLVIGAGIVFLVK